MKKNTSDNIENIIKMLQADFGGCQQYTIDKACDFIVKNDIKICDLCDIANKYIWENICSVINKLPEKYKIESIPALLRHLQDINWPGAFECIEILLKTPHDILFPYIEEALDEAVKQKDYSWIEGIFILVQQMNIDSSDFMTSHFYIEAQKTLSQGYLTSLITSLSSSFPADYQERSIIEVAEEINSGEVNVIEMYKHLENATESNFARVIRILNCDRRKTIVNYLLFELKSSEIKKRENSINILTCIEPEIYIKQIKSCIKQAQEQNDNNWMLGLKSIVKK